MATPIKDAWKQNPLARQQWAEMWQRQQRRESPAQSEQAICPDCDGMGVVRRDLPVGDPDFGKLVRCPNPNCPVAREQAARRYAAMTAAAMIPEAYQKATFARWERLAARHPFDPARADRAFDYMHEKWGAYAAAVAFVNAAERGWKFTLDEAAAAVGLPAPELKPEAARGRRNSIVFSGRNGVGKTWLAVAIANWCLDNGYPVVYTRLDQFLAALKKTYGDDAEGREDDVMRLHLDAPILVIDELTTRVTDWRLEKVTELMNHRYTHALPTIITTNTPRADFADVWDLTCAHRVLAMAHWIEVGGLVLRPLAVEWSGT